jgi:hypothetical protein
MGEAYAAVSKIREKFIAGRWNVVPWY